MKKEKSCGAIVYRQRDSWVEVLLICHKNGGHWAFPKCSFARKTRNLCKQIEKKKGRLRG